MLNELSATFLCITLAAYFNTSVLFGDYSQRCGKNTSLRERCILRHTNTDARPCNVSLFLYKH